MNKKLEDEYKKKIQQNTNQYQFYKVELFIDDSLVFDFTYDLN